MTNARGRRASSWTHGHQLAARRPTQPLAERCRDVVGPHPVLLAFQTVMELRFGALPAGWGELRRRRLERRLAEIAVVQPDDEMITVCTELRIPCQQAGHALGNKLHDGDRWIAATAHPPRHGTRLPRRRLHQHTGASAHQRGRHAVAPHRRR